MVHIDSNAACRLGLSESERRERWRNAPSIAAVTVSIRTRGEEDVEWSIKARELRRIKGEKPTRGSRIGVVVKQLRRGDPSSTCVMYQRSTRAGLRQADEAGRRSNVD